ncbi:MAG: M16 family metallopeptidase [Patescibacteria group bacterium]|jgi:predicted Zn-dependent peptidase|nr:pitrilysin family protein [Patescibacteria group bacterium]
MKLKEIKLENKLPVFLIRLPQSKTATVLVMYKTGSKYETRQNSGLSHFLEHMFFKGTEKRPNTLSISAELDSIGSEFNAFTGKECTGYYVKAARDKMPIAIDVLSDMLLNSKFDSEEIERERGVIMEEMKMYEDNPHMSVQDLLENCLYGDTPAGWDTIGFAKNIKSLQREDFIKYFESQYGTKSAAVFLAGNFTETEVKKLFKDNLSQMGKNNYQDKLKVVEKQSKPALKIKPKKTDQVAMSLGFRAFSANHKDKPVLKLLSSILGGSMSSRLFIELRERRGLAYFVRSSTQFYTDSGYISVSAGVPRDKVEEAIKVILNEFSRLKIELVSPAELKKAKDLLSGRLVVSMETSDSFSSWYGHQFIDCAKFLSPAEALRQIKQVSALDIQKLAKKLFINESLNLALIGNIKDENSIKKALKLK